LLLRASGSIQSGGVDVAVVRDAEAADQSGVPHADALIAFADAVITNDESGTSAARTQLRDDLGAEALVDASAVVANFQRMNRIADATGIPLDRPMRSITAELQTQLDLDGFVSAGNTPRMNPVSKAIGRLLLPIALVGLRAFKALTGRGKGHSNSTIESS